MKTKKTTVPVKGCARDSLRVKHQKSLGAARKLRVQRRRPVPIPRTVEMVDQKNEDWRSEKLKMMFMTAMGLTPKADCKGIVPPTLTVEEDFPSQRSSSSSPGTAETNAEAESDDDCICLGVFNFTTLHGHSITNA